MDLLGFSPEIIAILQEFQSLVVGVIRCHDGEGQGLFGAAFLLKPENALNVGLQKGDVAGRFNRQ